MPCTKQQTLSTAFDYWSGTQKQSASAGPFATEAECLEACKEGACCESNGTCNVRPKCQCQAVGQTFRGVGTPCTATLCGCCGNGESLAGKSVTLVVTQTFAKLGVFPPGSGFVGQTCCDGNATDTSTSTLTVSASQSGANRCIIGFSVPARFDEPCSGGNATSGSVTISRVADSCRISFAIDRIVGGCSGPMEGAGVQYLTLNYQWPYSQDTSVYNGTVYVHSWGQQGIGIVGGPSYFNVSFSRLTTSSTPPPNPVGALPGYRWFQIPTRIDYELTIA